MALCKWLDCPYLLLTVPLNRCSTRPCHEQNTTCAVTSTRIYFHACNRITKKIMLRSNQGTKKRIIRYFKLTNQIGSDKENAVV